MIYEKRLWALTVVLTIGLGQFGCASLPPNSRTAAVNDIRIDETVSDVNLQVQPGDEVRFVNLRKQDVQVEVPNLTAEDLVCEREFSGGMGSIHENVILKPNQSASLCFKKRAIVNYIVRMDTALAGSQKIVNGVVRVGTPLSQ